MAKNTSDLVLEAIDELESSRPVNQKIGKNATVERGGDRIIIPDNMSYNNAITWLQRQRDSEEQVVSVHDSIPCYPLDGAVAVLKALKEIYGFVSITDTPGFFGGSPPNLVQVPLADGTFETAVIGRIAIPTWDGGFLDIGIGRGEAALNLSGQIKKKNEREVKRVIAKVRETLQTSSIYRGQAIRVDLTFLHDDDHDFHPVKDAPSFFDIENVDELILNEVTDFELQTSVYLRIEKTDYCIANNIPLKHGALLMGSFGTGKTLCARTLAKKCVEHGWTFVYLTNPAHLAHMLRLAKLWGRTVVFSEDVDQAVTGGRTEAVNNIMNVIDGIDMKGFPIITVLTTNNPDDIEPGFLRAGRIDTTILFEVPDAPTAVRFVEKLARDDDGHSLIEPGTDLVPVGEAMAGFVPAFLNEAIQKAKCYAICREGADIIGRVSGTDLILAAKALKKHVNMVNRPKELTKEQKAHGALQLVGDVLHKKD
jgi:hypothetical protein